MCCSLADVDWAISYFLTKLNSFDVGVASRLVVILKQSRKVAQTKNRFDLVFILSLQILCGRLKLEMKSLLEFILVLLFARRNILNGLQLKKRNLLQFNSTFPLSHDFFFFLIFGYLT